MQMRLFSLPLDPEPDVFQLYVLLFASPAALEASTAFEDAPEDFIRSDIFSHDSLYAASCSWSRAHTLSRWCTGVR